MNQLGQVPSHPSLSPDSDLQPDESEVDVETGRRLPFNETVGESIDDERG